MAAVMMPYILPLLLGRTIDLDTMQIGVDIFPKSAIENPRIIQNPISSTHYKVVDNSMESRDLIDVEGSFSLKVKANVFNAGASGAYLSDSYNRENTVEVVVRALYQSVTEYLPIDAKPFDLWQQRGDALGTHYVRSITYGAELLGSVRMICNNTRDKQRIKATLEAGGRLEVFDLGVKVGGEYMKDISKSVESTQIKVFSSIPLRLAPNDMKTLKEALKNFPDDMKLFNGGKGVPMKMELWPLISLDPSKQARLKNRKLEANLDNFEQKFDDLLNTKNGITNWMKVINNPLSKEQEQKIGEFYGEVEKVARIFYGVIGHLDMTKDIAQLGPANIAYGFSIPGAYYKKYLLLRQSVTNDQGGWSLIRGNGATFTHWGKGNCSAGAETMSHGFVSGPSNFKGGSNFLCLPEKPDFVPTTSNEKDSPKLQGISYHLPNDKPQRLTCATCRLGAKGTVQTFFGRNQCPNDWEHIYDGILMSGAHDSIYTRFVCLDKRHDRGDEVMTRNSLVPDFALVSGSSDEEQVLLTCAVCAK